MKFCCSFVSGSYHKLQGIWFPTRIDEWASREAATHLQHYEVWDVDGKMMYTYARKHGTRNYFLESGNMTVLEVKGSTYTLQNTAGNGGACEQCNRTMLSDGTAVYNYLGAKDFYKKGKYPQQQTCTQVISYLSNSVTSND